MKTPHYDEYESTNSFIRHIPALAWLVAFAVFAVGGALSRDEPQQMADVAIAVPLEASAARSPVWQSPTAARDAAVALHEELDPVGVGVSGSR